MKVLKVYPHQRGIAELKKVEYMHNDLELLKRVFPNIMDNLLERLCQYLKSTKGTIIIDNTYDLKSGWFGQHVWLDGVDLSTNGYCFTSQDLYDHLESHK